MEPPLKMPLGHTTGMTDQPESSKPDETLRAAVDRMLDEVVVGTDRELEDAIGVVKASALVRELVDVASRLSDDKLRRLLHLARFMCDEEGEDPRCRVPGERDA